MNFGHVNILSNSLDSTAQRARRHRAPDIRKLAKPTSMRLEELRSSTTSSEQACNEQRDIKAA